MPLATSSNHFRRMRRRGHTPLVAAVAAGVVCTGVGIGSAAADIAYASTVTTRSAAAADAPQSEGNSNQWSLANNAIQPVYGNWTLTDGKQTSGMAASKESPLTPAAKLVVMQQRPDLLDYPSRYATGKICYNHTLWNWSAGSHSMSLPCNARDFVLTTDWRTGALSVSYQGSDARTDAVSDSGMFC